MPASIRRFAPRQSQSGYPGRLITRLRTRVDPSVQVSATVFLILRRMRAPLITLIIIFTLSVFGLTLIPGQDANGQAYRMGFFDAFYFMSYTATTIGFGEIPYAFTYGQRMWVVATIYLTVIGWAYALGSLLALIQDKAFRQALRLQRFSRAVSHLSEPFLLIAGYGRTGELLARSFDGLARQVVILDASETRIEALDMDTYQVDIPALAGDARNPRPARRCGTRPSALRGGAGHDRRRRGQSRRHHGGSPAQAGTAGRRPDGLDGDRRPDDGLRHPYRGQSLRPLRQPSPDRAARTRLVSVARVARSRTRRAVAGTRPPTGGR